MTKEEFFKKHFNDEYEDVDGNEFKNDIDDVIVEYMKKNRKKLTDEEMMKLAEIYKTNRVCVAQICDEVLDKSGGLLGEIREIYRKPF